MKSCRCHDTVVVVSGFRLEYNIVAEHERDIVFMLLHFVVHFIFFISFIGLFTGERDYVIL